MMGPGLGCAGCFEGYWEGGLKVMGLKSDGRDRGRFEDDGKV